MGRELRYREILGFHCVLSHGKYYVHINLTNTPFNLILSIESKCYDWCNDYVITVNKHVIHKSKHYFFHEEDIYATQYVKKI